MYYNENLGYFSGARPITINNVLYPSIKRLTQQELDNLNIKLVVYHGEREDGRFYNITEDKQQENIYIINTPKDLQECRDNFLKQARERRTEWFRHNYDDDHLCFLRTGKLIPEEKVDKATLVDSKYDQFKIDVNNSTNVNDLKIIVDNYFTGDL